MEQTILIPIDSHEQINPILPILNAIAKPGIRIVVLLRQRQENRHWVAGHWGFIATGMDAMLYSYIDGQADRARLEEHSAREKLARWQRELYPKTVEVEVISCRGSIRPLIEAAKRNGQVGLLMTPARSRAPFRWPVEQFARVRGLFRLPAHPPAVVLRHISEA